ncbi:MAG: peptidyl-prolyl cis-trans isomerase [Pirellulales bacterium]
MERLFYSIVIGAVVGLGAALWLPRQKAELIGELWQTVQAKAQAIIPPKRSSETATPLSIRGGAAQPRPEIQPLNWPDNTEAAPRFQRGTLDSNVMAVAYDDPIVDEAPAGYPNTNAPPFDPAAAAAANDGGAANGPAREAPPGPAPGFGFPRGEENTVQGVQINRFQGTQILARVGSDVILANEILPQVDHILEPHRNEMSPTQYDQQRMMMIQKFLADNMNIKAVLIDARRKIPKEAWPEIQKQVDKRFETGYVDNLMKKYQANSRAELVRKLDEIGSSMDLEKRSFGEQSLYHQWVQQQVQIDEEVTHEECVAYYREHLSDFEFEAEAAWEELTVRFDRFANKGEAFRAIAAMGNQILDGAPFAEVAKAGSHGRTAADGGVRRPVGRGSLASEVLDQAVFTLPVGTMSAILEADQGFYILRVTSRREDGRTPFEEAQVDIRKAIKKEREQEQIKKYLTRIKEQTTYWTIFDDPAQAEAQLSTRPESPRQR